MTILVTCKLDKDPIKNDALSCLQHFLHYKSMAKFFGIQGRVYVAQRNECLILNSSKILKYRNCPILYFDLDIDVSLYSNINILKKKNLLKINKFLV